MAKWRRGSVVVLHLVRYPIVKLSALFSKIRHRDPTVMPAWDVLRMATLEGAKVIGLGDEIGSLGVGKQADLLLVDLSAKSTITWNQDTALISHLVSELVTHAIYGQHVTRLGGVDF